MRARNSALYAWLCTDTNSVNTSIIYFFKELFLLVFIFMIVQQWRLSDNLSQLRAMNDAQLMERKAFQTALNAKEAENALRIKLLQKRKFNTLQL